MTDTPRIPPLPAAERTAEQQRLVEASGTELNIFTTLVRHPKLFEVFGRFAGRLLRRSLLPEDVRETLILRTAYRCRAGYEWAQHVEIARAIGMAAEVIAAIGTEDPELADEHLVVLINAADQLTGRHNLDDETWAALRERYDDQQLIELCMLVGDYAMIAGVLNALRVPLENGQSTPDWAAGAS
jgi:4-carboxymuconolactone decarboxylase